MTNYDNIPEELKKLNQWVCANAGSKVPMKSWENEAASSTNKDTWSSYSSAAMAVGCLYYDYLGFVFADSEYIGIDIDCGYDEDGFLSETAADIIGKCQSYTEKSRSGRGFHIVVKGSLPFKGKNNMAGVEIYKASRYFIMTGNVVMFKEIRENQDAIDYILNKYIPKMRATNKVRVNSEKIYKPIWDNAVDKALGRIKLRPIYPQITSGSRNLSLTSLAGSMYTIGYNKKAIYKELQYVNKISCSPPLPDKELQNICNSVTRYQR